MAHKGTTIIAWAWCREGRRSSATGCDGWRLNAIVRQSWFLAGSFYRQGTSRGASCKALKNCTSFRYQSLTFLCKLHDAKKMNPPSFHTRIRKVGALVTATLILPALAFVVVSLSFSAQAAEKKKIMGTDKTGPDISKTIVSFPGDDPKHELVVLKIGRHTTT